LIDPDFPIAGPVEVRQVAGLVARRIICHARANEQLRIGQRFGMIKFGSRTELIIPKGPGTTIAVKTGDKVRAGITVMARQPVHEAMNQESNRATGLLRTAKRERVGAGADKD